MFLEFISVIVILLLAAVVTGFIRFEVVDDRGDKPTPKDDTAMKSVPYAGDKVLIQCRTCNNFTFAEPSLLNNPNFKQYSVNNAICSTCVCSIREKKDNDVFVSIGCSMCDSGKSSINKTIMGEDKEFKDKIIISVCNDCDRNRRNDNPSVATE